MMLLNYVENVQVKRFLLFMFAVNCMLCTGTLLHADLLDYGADRAMFYDDETRLYWYDPGTFAGRTQDEIDAFVHEHSIWNWAGHDQLLDLVGSMSVANSSLLTDVLGSQTYTADSFYYWVGFIEPQDAVAARIGWYAGAADIQMFAALNDDPDSGDDTPVPVISGTILHGAWLYSENDPLEYTAPVPEPSTIFLIGTGMIGFAGAMRKFGRKLNGHRR
ncbi:MAG: PEP-CTERM sorting domain-containing protein [Deltaproteobacteria bacterium]|nr:PEP-CTERM sorting domain-containing protein [Deltaproteobacteria bacterium]